MDRKLLISLSISRLKHILELPQSGCFVPKNLCPQHLKKRPCQNYLEIDPKNKQNGYIKAQVAASHPVHVNVLLALMMIDDEMMKFRPFKAIYEERKLGNQECALPLKMLMRISRPPTQPQCKYVRFVPTHREN
jgi:hypothetical protein